MKKFLFLIVLLVAVGLTLMATCPEREAHMEAVKSVTTSVVNSEMDQSGIDGAIASIGTALGVNVVDAYLKNNLVIRDHTFYNVGTINYEGEPRIISVGIFNHVFTIDEETAREYIKEKVTPKL